MKIVKIEKKKRLYLIALDNDEKLYVTEDTIVRFMMTKGMTVTQEELEEIKTFAQFSYGKNLALYHLSFKKRTEKEVRDYLATHDIETDIIQKVVDNLKQDAWIDDTAYTRQVIEGNLSSGNKGAYHLQQKLQQKGIAKNILDKVLPQYDFTELATKVAEKLYNKYQGKFPHRALLDKIKQTLVQRGFSYQEANQAIQELSIDKDQESEETLIYKELEKQHRRLSKKYDGYDLKQRLIQNLARKGYDYDTIKSVLRDFL